MIKISLKFFRYSNYCNKISKLTSAMNSVSITNGRTSPYLRYQTCYQFVNIPITSKFCNSPLPSTLQPCIVLTRKQTKLNQKCVLLEHIYELVQKDPKLNDTSLLKFMISQLKSWENSTGGRMERVATVAWIIKKMRLTNQLSNLYQLIFNRIQEDQWYVNFQQAVKALQAYSDYKDRQKLVLILQKIQRNLNITIADVNMVYYQRICNSLIQLEHYRSPLWQKLEEYVVRNLSMPYTAKTFFDIFKCFAISRNGTSEFYQICQQVIQKGHLYSQNNRVRSNLGDFNSTGDYFALMIQTYAIVNKYTPFPLSPDFLDYMYKSLLSSRLEYRDISSLSKIAQHMPTLQFLPQQTLKVVHQVIEHKQFSQYHSLQDIKDLYCKITNLLGYVPEKLQRNVWGLVAKDIDRGVLPVINAIEIVDFLLISQIKQNTETINFQDIQLVQILNKNLQKKIKYMGPQQIKEVKQVIKFTVQIQNKVLNQLFLPKSTHTISK